MQIAEIPTQPWQHIAIDWITKLPKSKEPMTGIVYDSILVITDKLTKSGKFIPYRESSSAEDLSYVFMRNILGDYGMPQRIISDRDK